MKRDCGCQLQAGRLFLCSLHAGADDAAVSDRNYYWTEAPNGEYQILFRPDETEVTTITEPEDRNFFRDLAPVCAELNDLQAENARLRTQAEALAGALEDLQAVAQATCEGGYVDMPGIEILGEALEEADAALRAYREAPNDAG